MIEFENPAAFFFLLFIPVLYFLRYIKIFTHTNFPLVLGDWNGNHFEYTRKSRKIISFFIRLFMVLAYISCVFAFSNPVKHHAEKVYSSHGTDIVFVLDTSPSMGAKDIAGMRRIDAAREAILTLARENGGSSLGLVEMAKEAAVVVPPTMDRSVFFDKLDHLVLGEMGDGTAIGIGLSTAVYHLESSTAPKKCIVLITDGENNAGEVHPYTAAHLARSKKISLYVLGIGSKGNVPIEYVDPKSGHIYTGYIESNFDSASLSKVALEGDGKYFEASTMSSLIQSLNAVSKNESVVQSYHMKNRDTAYYSQFLLLAGIFVLLAWILRRFILQEVL